jgi:hypothetical protein
MSTKLFTFTYEPCIEIEIPLEYTYSHVPAKTDGPPDVCYEAETECEIRAPKNYPELFKTTFDLLREQAIKQFEAELQELESEHAPKLWAEEEGEE